MNKSQNMAKYGVFALLFAISGVFLTGCGVKNPLVKAVFVKSPPEIKVEKVLVEVPLKLDPKFVEKCPWKSGRPQSEYLLADREKTGCLRHYEALIDGLKRVYGVK